MRQLYDMTKKLSENHRKPERPVKSKEGEVITNIEEQWNRWVEHFKELLNQPAPLNPPNIEAAWPSNKSRVANQQDQTTFQQRHQKQT
ncbi:unnamed protein product [Schistosoma margrebowiei]|uniref:Uncharacterized protein n=1 Tax=Schistosoma margrebowiei TaxID=48269 RepID=A0A183MAR7_9TREM|nr:unnamed protein product [Schistosoma margrebowiei]